MLQIYTGTSILDRNNFLDEDYPPALLASLQRLFGEPIAPAAAVARILADVRARGDTALLA